jgi:hypothetical protein
MSTKLEDKRVGAWMGIAFVVLFVVGFLVFNTPHESNDPKWDTWWDDSGHRTTAVIGLYLMVLALLAFVWFMRSLCARFRDGGGMAITFGSLFVGTLLVSVLIRTALPGGKAFGDQDLPEQVRDWSMQFENLAFGLMLIPGALAAGAFAGVVSYLSRRDAILPNWLTIAGFIVAVLQLVSGFFLPFILFVLWVLVVSIALMRSSGSSVVTIGATA